MSFRLTDDELADVAAALEGAALADGPDDAMSDPPIADAPTYEVAYGDDQVLTDELAAPDELRPLFEVLGVLIDRERGGA